MYATHMYMYISFTIQYDIINGTCCANLAVYFSMMVIIYTNHHYLIMRIIISMHTRLHHRYIIYAYAPCFFSNDNILNYPIFRSPVRHE